MNRFLKDYCIPRNYITVIILLNMCVLFYVFFLQSEVQKQFDNQMYIPTDVLPIWFKTPPDKTITYHLDLEKYLHKTDPRFLSFSIDTSQIQAGLRNPSLYNKKLRHMVSHLGGGYLRIGGRAADSLFFSPAFRVWPDKTLPLDGGLCAYAPEKCLNNSNNSSPRKFSMHASDWNDLNSFAEATGLKLLFDFNVLLRQNDFWDPSNAELLLDFSFAYQYDIDWQLGNEPNSFKHVYGFEVPPENLAKDFNTLRALLQRYRLYNSSLLVGPDVTNPRIHKELTEPPVNYLLEYLKSKPDIDAITWHHYYMGPDATLEDFLAVETYDQFIKQCNIILQTVKDSKIEPKPIWIGETGSTYGGGALNLSDRFVSSFLWADKLGAGAKHGISLIVRQSLYRGHYALLDPTHMTPNPDYWVSVLHRKFVRETVLNLTAIDSSKDNRFRVYAQCSNNNLVTIFGVNIANVSQGFFLPLPYKGLLFCLHSSDLQSKEVKLNGHKLLIEPNGSLSLFKAIVVDMSNMVPIGPYTIFFLQINMTHPACN